ncbi:class IIb bacteriocin, lactobin A/cerein 7B family [Aliiglaciecola sp. LCG003]|uniref:class IIb bacteriocin, lactobin A/cerein 7B family n=1 Tax=Aliiglaciecola sp. LCG003 TaxID=3053655 RepID=UPI0025723793|nr:class IIb bacteriocin, lactobin A/cerein 7B family [Aliiglaciecola sp. LCG003]WJG09937.1 class IIb bacteriocin, lactobin A/cerein 7B family [Aliiglaciecola sp. LCG003]
MRELNEMQLEEVNGGVAPLAVALGVIGYAQALSAASKIGLGIGYGIYDATH